MYVTGWCERHGSAASAVKGEYFDSISNVKQNHVNLTFIILKTVRDLASYENVCKNARETLKQSMILRGKEQLKQRAQQKNSVCKNLHFIIYFLKHFFSLKSSSTYIFFQICAYFLFIANRERWKRSRHWRESIQFWTKFTEIWTSKDKWYSTNSDGLYPNPIERNCYFDGYFNCNVQWNCCYWCW